MNKGMIKQFGTGILIALLTALLVYIGGIYSGGFSGTFRQGFPLTYYFSGVGLGDVHWYTFNFIIDVIFWSIISTMLLFMYKASKSKNKTKRILSVIVLVILIVGILLTPFW